MFNFLQNSIRELKHVVWPTQTETKKYFVIVLTVLVVFWLYLFIASSLFSEILFFLKDIVWTNPIETNIPNIDMNSIVVNTGSLTESWSIIDVLPIVDSWSIVE